MLSGREAAGSRGPGVRHTGPDASRVTLEESTYSTAKLKDVKPSERSQTQRATRRTKHPEQANSETTSRPAVPGGRRGGEGLGRGFILEVTGMFHNEAAVTVP